MKKLIFILIVCCVFTFNAFSQNEEDKIFENAQNHLKNKNWQKASQLLSYLIKKNKNGYEYFYFRGLARKKELKNNNADNDFKRVLSISEHILEQKPNSKCYKYLGDAQYQLGQYTNSINSYNAGLELVENDSLKSNFYYSLGMVYQDKEEYRKSIESFDQAIYLNVGYAETYKLRAASLINFGDKVCACNDWIVYRSMMKDTIYPKYTLEHIIKVRCSDYVALTKSYWDKIILKVKNTTPENSISRMDSIEITQKFYEVNAENISEMADSISTIPINLCLNDIYQFNLNVNKNGELTLKSIIKGSPNPVLNNFIIAKINETKLEWKPRIVNGKDQDFTWVLKYKFVKGLSKKRNRHLFKGYYGRQLIDNRRVYEGTNVNRCVENDKHYELGVKYYLDKKYKMAKLSFEKALDYNISDIDSHYNLGMTLLKLDKKEAACDCFEFNMKLGDKASYSQYKSNCQN